VEGLFELPPGHPALAVCANVGVQVEQDGMLVVRQPRAEGSR